jgi:hypothetical protein
VARLRRGPHLSAHAGGMNGNPEMARRWNRVFKVIGLVLFILTGVGGLLIVGAYIAVIISLGRWAKNK